MWAGAGRTTVRRVPSRVWPGCRELRMGTTAQLSSPMAAHMSPAVSARLIASLFSALPKGMGLVLAL